MHAPTNGLEEPDENYHSYGLFDPLDVERLLKRFEAEGVRFRFASRTSQDSQYLRNDAIEIFVNRDDDEVAKKIMTDGWRL